MESSGSAEMPAPEMLMDCGDKSAVLSESAPYEVLSLLSPRNETVWMDRTKAWSVAFNAHIAVLSAIYLVIGIVSVALIVKRDCTRLKVKTFLAVYLAMAILGFTRGTFLILDPFGITGFIATGFPQWVIVSRFLASFGFPSLVASYTLLIMTMFKLTGSTTAGKQWYQYYKYVIPIFVTPYVIVLSAEAIGHVVPYPGVLAVVVCHIFFSLWGIGTCITFLVAGRRLKNKIGEGRKLRTLRRNSASGANIARSEAAASTTIYENKQRKIIQDKTRKIRIITYATAIVGLLYSLATAAKLSMAMVLLYHECLGLFARGNTAVWLFLQTFTRIVEITLAFVMLYSITDVPVVMKFMVLLAKCRCRHEMTVSGSLQSDNVIQTEVTSTSSGPPNNDISVMIEVDLEAANGVTPAEEANEQMESIAQSGEITPREDNDQRTSNPKAFQFRATKDSGISIASNLTESVSSTPSMGDSSRRATPSIYDDSGVITYIDSGSTTNSTADITSRATDSVALDTEPRATGDSTSSQPQDRSFDAPSK